MSRQEFKAEFEKNNLSYPVVRELYRKQLLLNKYLNLTILSKIDITEDDVRVYYDATESQVNYDSVKLAIRDTLYNQKKDEMYRALIEGLKSSSEIRNIVYSDLSKFTKCLSMNGVIMYGVSTDSYTIQQKYQFGNDFAYLNYVECLDSSTNTVRPECSGMRVFPAWKIKGEIQTGIKTIDHLSDVTGCKLY